MHTSTSATIYAQKTGVAESYICDRVDGTWTEWRRGVTNSDLEYYAKTNVLNMLIGMESDNKYLVVYANGKKVAHILTDAQFK